jgi:hypothetical protein
MKMTPQQLDSISVDDLVAASKFRDSLLSKADGQEGPFPYWHGWAIVQAYLAGLTAGRKQSEE